MLDGELSIRCGGDAFGAAAGSFVFLPRGRPYRFWAADRSARPQTIGYALLASPVALAAWMLDHDTDSYYKISAPSWTSSPRAISPGTGSSTTSRSTG
jgi:predicted component of type VI protein secretion system